MKKDDMYKMLVEILNAVNDECHIRYKKQHIERTQKGRELRCAESNGVTFAYNRMVRILNERGGKKLMSKLKDNGIVSK